MLQQEGKGLLSLARQCRVLTTLPHVGYERVSSFLSLATDTASHIGPALQALILWVLAGSLAPRGAPTRQINSSATLMPSTGLRTYILDPQMMTKGTKSF